MDAQELAKTSFVLGIQIAEQVHGIRRKPHDPAQKEIFKILKEVASGESTTMDTVAEVAAEVPIEFRPSAERLSEMSRIGRQNQKYAAQLIATSFRLTADD